MGQSKLDGTFLSGPPSVTDGTFPSSTMTMALKLLPDPKSWQRATGVLQRAVNIASPSFLTLDGLGTGKTVEEGNLLVMRTNAPLTLRITQAITGGDVTATFKVNGLCILEFPEGEPLTLLEVQGNSTIEYFAQGQR